MIILEIVNYNILKAIAAVIMFIEVNEYYIAIPMEIAGLVDAMVEG